MSVNLNILNICLWLILLGVFFLPFNSWEGISFLGEYYRDSCILFFLASFFLIIFKQKIKLPLHSSIFYLIIIFVAWALISTALNFQSVLEYSFKQTTGITRFNRQYISLIIASLILPITFYNSFIHFNIKDIILKIRKAIYYSLIIVVIYAIIETLIVKFNFVFLKKSLLNLFDYFPFVEAKTDLRLKRISSVTFEPPALGTYLITIFSWMASYILTSKNKLKYIPALIVIFLAFCQALEQHSSL